MERSKRTKALENVAETIQNMIQQYGRRKDIQITFYEVDEEVLEAFTEHERSKHHLLTGDEVFFIFEVPDPHAIDPQHLLYTKCVTADNVLTAAAELMDLVSKKF